MTERSTHLRQAAPCRQVQPSLPEHCPVGRRTLKQLPNGALSYFAYDAASRQTSILNVESDMTPISATYYEWNEDGLPTVQRRRGDYDVDHEYVYDDVPRQIGENIKEPDGTLLHGFQYWYDEAGQRIRKSVYPDQLTYYEFNAANQLVTSQHHDGSWAYFSSLRHAAAPRRRLRAIGGCPKGTEDRLSRQDNLMVEAAAPGVATTNEFEWNAAQQRTKKTDTDGTAYMLRDGQKIVAERTTGDVLRARYANEGSSLYSFLLSDTRNSSTVWPTYDMLGTVQSVLNSSAAITGSSLREAFGTSQGSTGALPGPFGYVGALGYYNDPDLAMPLLSIRHYAAQRGMFVARDRVLRLPRYTYVDGRPSAWRDASGKYTAGVDGPPIEGYDYPIGQPGAPYPVRPPGGGSSGYMGFGEVGVCSRSRADIARWVENAKAALRQAIKDGMHTNCTASMNFWAEASRVFGPNGACLCVVADLVNDNGGDLSVNPEDENGVWIPVPVGENGWDLVYDDQWADQFHHFNAAIRHLCRLGTAMCAIGFLGHEWGFWRNTGPASASFADLVLSFRLLGRWSGGHLLGELGDYSGLVWQYCDDWSIPPIAL